jgi:predicted transcriptional regulator
MSKFDKMRALVQKHFPLVWFSSRELQSVFEQELKEPITLSTVATYLSRMATKGFVLKTGPSNSLKYKGVTDVPQATLRQRVP